MESKLPFIESEFDGWFYRTFSHKTDENEFMWHRDKEDRIIESINSTDWLIQFDNHLPQKIEGQIFIPKETYHRVIKGDNDLLLKVKKLNN